VMADAAKSANSILPSMATGVAVPSRAGPNLSSFGSFVACLGLQFGVFPQLAATLKAAMLGTIAVVC
jgi:hypothetical protein